MPCVLRGRDHEHPAIRPGQRRRDRRPATPRPRSAGSTTSDPSSAAPAPDGRSCAAPTSRPPRSATTKFRQSSPVGFIRGALRTSATIAGPSASAAARTMTGASAMHPTYRLPPPASRPYLPVRMERSNPLKAAAWMMGAVVSFVAMAVAGRAIELEMNTFELMLYRSAIGFAIVLALLARSDAGFAQVRTAHLPLHLKRNLFHYTGQNLWFYAVTAIPLSQLVALEFTNPIWVALLAPFLLGERLTRTRILGALLGFAGVLIVAQPGSTTLGPGHAAALIAAVCFALTPSSPADHAPPTASSA